MAFFNFNVTAACVPVHDYSNEYCEDLRSPVSDIMIPIQIVSWSALATITAIKVIRVATEVRRKVIDPDSCIELRRMRGNREVEEGLIQQSAPPKPSRWVRAIRAIDDQSAYLVCTALLTGAGVLSEVANGQPSDEVCTFVTEKATSFCQDWVQEIIDQLPF